MALGFAEVLSPPTARDRRRGTLLVDVLRDLPEAERLGGDAPFREVAQRWRMGVTFQPWPRDQWVTLEEDPCVDHVKADALDHISAVEATPFTSYKEIACSTLSNTAEEFKRALSADAALNASDILATALMNAAADLNVTDAAADFNTTSHSPARSVGIVDEFLDTRLGGAMGLVLMDPQTAATAGEALEADGFGNFYTRSGHRVVIHSQFRTKATEDAGGALGADGGMIYGMGDLYGVITEARYFDDGAGQLYDLTRNEISVRAELYGILAFEVDTVVWQRVTLPT